jgi:hypothetical protein
MRRHLAALCGCLLLAAAGARAQDLQGASNPREELSMAGIERDPYASRELGRNLDQPRCGVISDEKSPGPMRVLDACGEARPFEWLGLFAASRSFRLDGSQPAYDLEGGAALDVGGGLAVTGGYRVLGFGWIGSDPPEPSAAPVLGLRLSF